MEMEAQFLRLKIVIFLILAFVVAAFASALGLGLSRLFKKPLRPAVRRVAWAFLLASGVGGLCFLYGVFIEADWLEESHEEVATPKLALGERLRVVHLTDLHVSEWTPALRELPLRIAALKPDLLVYTGDSINRREGAPVLRELMRSLEAKYGRFAVHGNHDVWYWSRIDLFGDGVATALDGRPEAILDGRVLLCGAPYGDPGAITRCLEASDPKALRLVAYHTPDLVEDLQPHAPDVYFAGHTHGGQVRLPFFGAVATMSKFDKKYEMGRYQVGPTTLYVSRGIGFEPKPAPRVRFLCRPEIAVIDLVGTGT